MVREQEDFPQKLERKTNMTTKYPFTIALLVLMALSARSATTPAAGGTVAPGNAQTLPPRQVPPAMNRPQQVVPGTQRRTDQLGGATNIFGALTNQFGFLTNQFGSATNFDTNQAGLTPNAAPVTRAFPADAANPPALPQAMTQDRAVTPTDRTLLVQLHRALMASFRPSTSLVPVHFQVQEGVVTIVGSVPTLEQKQRVLSSVQGLPGVAQVVDRLELRPGAGNDALSSGSGAFTNQFGMILTNFVPAALTPTVPLEGIIAAGRAANQFGGVSNQTGSVAITNSFVGGTNLVQGFGTNVPVVATNLVINNATNQFGSRTNLAPTSRPGETNRIFETRPGQGGGVPPGVERREQLPPPGLQPSTNAVTPNTGR